MADHRAVAASLISVMAQSGVSELLKPMYITAEENFPFCIRQHGLSNYYPRVMRNNNTFNNNTFLIINNTFIAAKQPYMNVCVTIV